MMNDKELTIMAEKVAKIIMAEQDKRSAEYAKRLAQDLYDAPIKTTSSQAARGRMISAGMINE